MSPKEIDVLISVLGLLFWIAFLFYLLFPFVNKKLGTRCEVRGVVILKRMEGEDPFFPQKETVVLKPYLTYRISVLVGSEVYEARVNNRQYGGIVLGDVVQIVLHHGRFLNKKYAEIR